MQIYILCVFIFISIDKRTCIYMFSGYSSTFTSLHFEVQYQNSPCKNIPRHCFIQEPNKLQILIQDKPFMKFRTKCLRYSSARPEVDIVHNTPVLSQYRAIVPRRNFLPQYLYTIIYIHHLGRKDYSVQPSINSGPALLV